MGRIRWSMGLALLLLVVGSAGQVSQAQDGPETSALLIEKRTCLSADALEEPGGCEPGEAGVRFEVMTTDGAVVGECTTEATVIQASPRAACWVEDVPLGEVVVTEDLSTAPPGLVPLANPQTVTVRDPGSQGPDFINAAVFINVPVTGEEPPADGGETGSDETTDAGSTVALPATGAGVASAAGPRSDATGATLLALAGAAAVAYGLRRRLAA